MRRLIESELLAWKRAKTRHPVLLDGARQTGKTYLLTKRFAKHFKAAHHFDFLARKELHQAFECNLTPAEVLSNLELIDGISIDATSDLIIFDEIGECPRAVTSLKYFSEQMPRAHVCASGSSLGMLQSFPVGKTHNLELLPMNFEEFLMACGEERLLDAYRNFNCSTVAHSKLWAKLLDYYYVGGMPEAVSTWYDLFADSALRAAEQVRKVHKQLIARYERDFSKYAGAQKAIEVGAAFHSVARQLQNNRDNSVRRYQFKGVINKKKRYAELFGVLYVLDKMRLTAQCHIIATRPTTPLQALIKENIFKLFLFDVGLFGSEIDISYGEQQQQEGIYKGLFAENFVCNELRAAAAYPLQSWSGQKAEIEFLHKDRKGNIIPIEVKSDSRTQAKSLKSYRDKYQPTRTLKLVGKAVPNHAGADNPILTKGDMVWPLYYAARAAEL